MNKDILMFEELSLNALPALQTQFYDGWVLRYTDGYGYTSRANSVNLLYPSTLDPREKIKECEKRYFAQGLPAIFKITDGTDTEMDKMLELDGYEVLSPTYFMTSDLTAVKYTPGMIDMVCGINDEWLTDCFTLSHYEEDKKRAIAKQVFNNIKVTTLCGRIIKNSATIACGLCIIERGCAGLFNIVVDESERGKGYGREICQSLLCEAQRLGAHTTYLQVVQENYVAIDLYTKMGYKTLYSYWYRVKKEKS